MPRLFGKIALTAGGALLATALLVVAYISGGVLLLSFLLMTVFLIGGSVAPQGIFLPIIVGSAVIFGLSSWAFASLGVGTFWLWKRKSQGTPPSEPR